jgi:uncharacterized membrane protein (DUF2068 family)
MAGSKQRAPSLYAIIAIKLLKGVLLLLLGLGAYNLADDNLPDLFQRTLRWIHLDPEKQFFSDLALQIGRMTAAHVRWVAAGTLLYSVFSLVEAVGLLLRISWVGWLAIGESAFFIPIELFELNRQVSLSVAVILLINVWIVWYLYMNRQRLFHH